MVRDLLVRPLVTEGARLGARLRQWVRAIAAAITVFVAALVCSAIAEPLLIGVAGVSSEGYGLLFAGWMIVTIYAMGVVGRAQLN